MKREELLNSWEYWMTDIQMNTYSAFAYCKKNNPEKIKNMSKAIGIEPYEIDEIEAGEWMGSVGMLISVSLYLGKFPVLKFVDTEEYIKLDKDKFNNIKTILPKKEI